MGARLYDTVWVKLTDVIREELMDYIYSDDSLEDADHLTEIFKALDGIETRLRDLEDEVKDLRKRNASLVIERDHFEYKLKAATVKEDPD